jgi:hypothetical protein
LSDQSRLEALELALARMERELASLRAEIRGAGEPSRESPPAALPLAHEPAAATGARRFRRRCRSGSSRVPPTPDVPERAPPERASPRTGDIEQLVGRYGVLALASGRCSWASAPSSRGRSARDSSDR